MMQRWAIYHGDREYAKEHGDPVLHYVYAESKGEAEAGAVLEGFGYPAGVWAASAPPEPCPT